MENTYTPPLLEVFEFVMEKGFAGSGDTPATVTPPSKVGASALGISDWAQENSSVEASETFSTANGFDM